MNKQIKETEKYGFKDVYFSNLYTVCVIGTSSANNVINNYRILQSNITENII